MLLIHRNTWIPRHLNHDPVFVARADAIDRRTRFQDAPSSKRATNLRIFCGK